MAFGTLVRFLSVLEGYRVHGSDVVIGIPVLTLFKCDHQHSSIGMISAAGRILGRLYRIWRQVLRERLHQARFF